MELLNRMMKKEVLMKRENITIDLLLLSDGNPRLEPSLGEDEAIINMVKDQKEKLVSFEDMSKMLFMEEFNEESRVTLDN